MSAQPLLSESSRNLRTIEESQVLMRLLPMRRDNRRRLPVAVAQPMPACSSVATNRSAMLLIAMTSFLGQNIPAARPKVLRSLTIR